MLQLQRKVTAGFISLVGLTAIIMSTGCGGGLDTEEAVEICNEREKREPSQFDGGDTVMNSCITCYEDCGNDCSSGSVTDQGFATFLCDDVACTPDGC